MSRAYPFIEKIDRFNASFFTLPGIVGLNISDERRQGADNIASLLFPFIDINRRATGRFQTDLTSRDDVLLALISLFIVLMIDSIVSTTLLRSKNGMISNFGFSIKQIIELLRDLNFRTIFVRRKPQNGKKRNINVRLVSIAVFILISSLGLEVMILFLTNPTFKKVTNRTATFRILQPVTPEWLNVNFHAAKSLNRPCESVALQEVDQGSTRINGCVETSLSFEQLELFDVQRDDIDEDISLSITTNMHAYGSDHKVDLNGREESFETRVFFTLSDGRSRFMKALNSSIDEAEGVRLAHVQLIAYVYSMYQIALKRSGKLSRNLLEDLKSLRFDFDEVEGEEIDVLRLSGEKFDVKSRKYITKTSGFIPQGDMFFIIAQHHFRGLAAIQVADADEQDLFMEDGLHTRQAVVWRENMRVLNWLSLLIACCTCLILLYIIRLFLKPGSTADIAAVYVKSAVGADPLRSPIELQGDENEYFNTLAQQEYDEVIGTESQSGSLRKRMYEEV